MEVQKKCWICKRTLVTESWTGLCPKCTNAVGTAAIGVALVGATIGLPQLVKHKDKVAKVAVKLIKH